MISQKKMKTCKQVFKKFNAKKYKTQDIHIYLK